MEFQTRLVVGLAAIDLMILAIAYFQFRARPPMDRQSLLATGMGLAGFIFHAFLFFEEAFLIVQLTTISTIFGICWLQHQGRLTKSKAQVTDA
jgi:drug/metabolite transporter (DMT)-like permease